MSVRRSTAATVDDVPGLPDEHVVLVDARGRPAGTLPKVTAHSADTALHRAFSCHVVGLDGRMLFTRRPLAKRTWPGVWTNGCCGHPQLGEKLRSAVTRRLRDELGVAVTRMSVVVPDFVYRAEMDDGTVEHELCPVVVAEVEAVEWCTWSEFVDRAVRSPQTLSPWAVHQLDEMTADAWTPEGWTGRAAPTAGAAEAWDRLLDDTGAVDTAPTSGPVAADHATVSEQLSARLAGLLATKSAQLVAVDIALADVVEEIGGLLTASGKRLRPAFVYWGHRATGADHHDAVVDVAAAVELLHTFAILHDDVMDGSEHRRGRLTAHRAFAARHDVLGLYGDPEATGKSDLDDLREGKRTLLVLRALRLATDPQAGVLREALGNPDLDVGQAARVRAVVADTGALASVEALLVAKHLEAVHAVGVVPEPARTALTQLADLVVWRRA